VTQLDIRETGFVPAPDFCMDLNVLQSQNNLIWLPSVTSAPALLALRVLPQTHHPPVIPQPCPKGGGARGKNARSSGNGGGGASLDTAPRRSHRCTIHNANRDPRFVGETTFAVNVRTRCVVVVVAILTAGTTPQVIQNGAIGPLCILWHARDQ
jgi:hypothetical protein